MVVMKKILVEKECEPTFTGATLLSANEAITLLTKEERKYKYPWWLRAPSKGSYLECLVNLYGDIYFKGCLVSYSCDIRPALIISNLGGFKVGDIFSIREYDFKIISPTLAWMYFQDIGADYFDDKSNDYETSHVKQIIDAWFEKLMDEMI